MSKIEKLRKVIKSAKVVKKENNGYTSCVIATELINGKKMEVRIKDYDLPALLDEVEEKDIVVTLETKHSDEKNVDFECFVVSIPDAGYDKFAFLNGTQMAIMTLLANKTK